MPRVRLAEVCAALSLTTDLASGAPFEKGLRTCVVATAFAEVLGAGEDDRAAVFYAALLRSLGCTASASENAALFVDDTAFQAAFKRLDPGSPEVFDRQLRTFGSWAPRRQDELRQRFLRLAPVEGPPAARACCEVSRALGGLLGLPGSAVDALDDVYERWDGRGLPGTRRGEELSWVVRVAWEAWQDNWAQRAGVPHLARRTGPTDAAGFFAVVGSYTLHDFTLLDVIGDGRQVAAEVRTEFSTPNGGRFADEVIHLWTFDESGRVVRFRHYVDTAKHIAASRGQDTRAR